MKKILFCLFIVLVTNISNAQKNYITKKQKDSITTKAIDLQECILLLQNMRTNLLIEISDSLQACIAKREKMNSLFISGINSLESTKIQNGENLLDTVQFLNYLIDPIKEEEINRDFKIILLWEQDSVLVDRLNIYQTDYNDIIDSIFIIRNKKQRKKIRAKLDLIEMNVKEIEERSFFNQELTDRASLIMGWYDKQSLQTDVLEVKFKNAKSPLR